MPRVAGDASAQSPVAGLLEAWGTAGNNMHAGDFLPSTPATGVHSIDYKNELPFNKQFKIEEILSTKVGGNMLPYYDKNR